MEVWRALWELSSDGKAKAGCRGCRPGQGRVWRAMQAVYIAVLQLWSQEDQFPDPHGAHPWMPWSLKQNGIVQPALCIHGYPESAVCCFYWTVLLRRKGIGRREEEKKEGNDEAGKEVAMAFRIPVITGFWHKTEVAPFSSGRKFIPVCLQV